MSDNTEVQKALAAVRDNQPDDYSPLPWRSFGDKVRDSKGAHTPVAYCDSILDAACIAARVTFAPVLAVEVEQLSAALAAAQAAVRKMKAPPCTAGAEFVDNIPVSPCLCHECELNWYILQVRRAVGLDSPPAAPEVVS